MARAAALLVPALAVALAAGGCRPSSPVGEKASADNTAFDDDNSGFFGSWFGGPKKRKTPPGPAVPGECRFTAWASAAEPTEIRSGPGNGFTRLGTLPAARPTDAGLRGIEAATFRVVEARHGWFRIEGASYQRLDFDEEPIVYPAGWIPGKALSFAVQSDFAYEMPDPASPVVASSWIDPRGVQPLHIESPQYCKGDWVMLTVAGYDGENRLAWLRGACGDLESTCEEVVSDNPAKPADLPTYRQPPPTPPPEAAADDPVSSPSSAVAGASTRPRR